MFSLLDVMNRGREVVCKGKRYKMIGVLEDGYSLAIEFESEVPAPVFIVRDDQYCPKCAERVIAHIESGGSESGVVERCPDCIAKIAKENNGVPPSTTHP